MALDGTEYILIAAFGAFLLCICIACCCCIYAKCCGSDERTKNKMQYKALPVNDTEDCVLHVRQAQPNNVDLEKGLYINTTNVNSNTDYTDGSIYEYITNEDEVAERAAKEPGTLLWINEEQVFINTPGGKHAEILFITSKKQPLHISTMKIKNSPCHNCSTELINHFRHRHQKPTIFVGRIWHLDDLSDREGLQQLLKKGFKIRVWQTLHDKMYGSDTITENYIRQLQNEI